MPLNPTGELPPTDPTPRFPMRGRNNTFQSVHANHIFVGPYGRITAKWEQNTIQSEDVAQNSRFNAL